MSGRYAEVVLPLPLHQSYTYAIPESLTDVLAVGQRVTVPVRSRRVTGLVTAIDVPAPAVRAKAIHHLLDTAPAVAPVLLQLAEWIAGYYGAPIGLAVRLLLPAPFWTDSEAPAEQRERVIVLSGATLGLLERYEAFGRRARQRALYETIEEMGGAVPARHLVEQSGFSMSLIRALVQSGLARVEMHSLVRDLFPPGSQPVPPPAAMSPAQSAALQQVEALAPGEGLLLRGVTGSGKTFVYLEAVRRQLALGRGAIVLVPEIALTPQTVARFRGAFGDQVAVLHSAQSDGERADAWRLLRSGERQVAVGARSAVFAPVRNLGLIVVDEEHESSYKNGETPRYHARDVADVRARLEGAAFVLGSATPSLESHARTLGLGRPLQLGQLPDRIGGHQLPVVRLVDLRAEPLVREAFPVAWSHALDAAVGDALGRSEQILLLLNRRGFANFLQCRSCGGVRECPSCSVALVVHRSPSVLRCHHCGLQSPMPDKCDVCGGEEQQMRGVGTQQVERIVAERFPEARIARMDLDSTSSKWSHHRILDRLDQGTVDILIGTQMIAKGLDVPNVTLVGVIDADLALFLPDFRAAERTFQLLAQVAGRAGRGPRGGTVLVQTRAPEHYALQRAAGHDTLGFLEDELALRRSPPYPPHLELANIILTGEDEALTGAQALSVAEWCRRVGERHGLDLNVLGPAPAPLARLRKRWRWHVLAKGSSSAVGHLVRALAEREAGAGVSLVTDRDPVTLL